jgi:hypothetical protein
MGTRHRRIGLVEDPELAAAIRSTRDLLDAGDVRSTASHVRRLALLGAEALMGGDAGSRAGRLRRRILRRPGVRPATRPLADLPWLGTGPIDGQRRASRELDRVRGER